MSFLLNPYLKMIGVALAILGLFSFLFQYPVLALIAGVLLAFPEPILKILKRKVKEEDENGRADNGSSDRV